MRGLHLAVTLAAAVLWALGGCRGPAPGTRPHPVPSSSSPAPAAPPAPSAPAAPPAPAPDVPTFHGDPQRTGWQQAEPVLTPEAVAGPAFGEIWSAVLDGAVHAQPLYAAGVVVRGLAHDVVYVATEADSVWALDARDGTPLWGPASLGTPVPRSALPCGNIDPVGITSTPVLDRARGALYVVGMTSPDGGRTLGYVAAALDLATGRMLPGWPVPVAPPGLDPRVQQQRGALLLLPSGLLEVPFGGFFGDCGAYHGWVVQIPVDRPADQSAYQTPSRAGAGLWTAGGLAWGPEGAIFGVTGNSTDPVPGDMGNAVLRLLPGPPIHQPAGPAGFFQPSNALALDRADRDLGSGGPLVLPTQPGAHRRLLFVAGKQGVGYLVDRDNPGGNGTGNGIAGEALWSGCLYGDCAGAQAAVFTTAAYFRSPDGSPYVVTAGRAAQPAPCTGRGGLVAWRLTPAPALEPAWCGPSMADPGSPTVSSRGTAGPVVWAVDAGLRRLVAVDGQTGRLLRSVGLPPVQRFTVPTVAGGMVFVAANGQVLAFGLRPAP
jgi:hypothetical protein